MNPTVACQPGSKHVTLNTTFPNSAWMMTPEEARALGLDLQRAADRASSAKDTRCGQPSPLDTNMRCELFLGHTGWHALRVTRSVLGPPDIEQF